jgi:DNA polymerase III delta subunit
MNFWEFLKKFPIQKGEVVVFYGEEEYYFNLLIENLKKKFSNVEIFHGEDIVIEDLPELLGEVSLFQLGKGGNLRIVVIKNFEKVLKGLRKKQKEFLRKILNKSFSKSLLLLIQEEIKNRDWNKEPWKILKERAKYVIPVKPLSEKSKRKWILKMFEKEKIEISPDAVDFLLESITDLTELKNEIEKLILYAKKEKKLDLTTVKALITPNPKYTIYDFQEAFFKKEMNKAFKILQHLVKDLSNYERTILIFQLEGLILNTLNRLLIAKEKLNEGRDWDNIAKELGIFYDFQKKKFKEWLNLWTEEELINLLKKLYELDFNIKVKFSSPLKTFTSLLL